MLQDDEMNFVNVEELADPAHIKNLTFSYASGPFYPVKDTFWLAANENLRFHLSGGVFRVTAEVDGTSIHDENHNATIWVDSDGLVPGPHELKITQFVKSGTGSLADKLNVEMASYTATFILMIGDYKFTPIIQNIEVVDAGVHIQWNSYERGDFQAYEIRRYRGWDSQIESYEPHRKYIITDPAQTSFTDTTYVGGIVNYIVTVDKGGQHFISKPREIRFQYKLNMRLTPSDPGRARLSWDIPPFQKNTRYMSVIRRKMFDETKLADNIPATETSVEIDYSTVFGELTQFSLQMWGDTEGTPMYYDHHAVFEDLMPGIRTPPITDILYNETEDNYYLLNNNSPASGFPTGLFTLDTDLRIKDTLTTESFGNLMASPDGTRLFLLRGSSILELDHAPLTVMQSFNAGVAFNFSNEQNFAASNNNYVLYRHTDKASIIDFTSKSVLLTVSAAATLHISPDGQYFANGADIYRFNGTQFATVSVLPFAQIRFVHFLKSGDGLFIATADKAIIYDHISGLTIRQYDFKTELHEKPEFNDVTMTYFTRAFELQLLNISTGEQNAIDVNYVGNTTIEGEYLFHYSGFGLKPYQDE